MENCKKSPLDLTAKLEPTGLHVMFREAKSEDDGIPNLYVNTSLTRLGDFWKFLVSNYLSKVAQMFSDFWGIWKHHFYVKTALVTFLGNFRKNWATFLIHYLVTLAGNQPISFSFWYFVSFFCSTGVFIPKKNSAKASAAAARSRRFYFFFIFIRLEMLMLQKAAVRDLCYSNIFP